MNLFHLLQTKDWLLKSTASTLLAAFTLSMAFAGSLYAADEPVSTASMADTSALTEGESGLESGEEEDTITMSFDGASLKDVLLLFSQKTGMNFVASQDIEQRKVTVYFESVSPKEALDAIMATNNLVYTRKTGSSIYMVYTKRAEAPELVTKVFRLKYARLSSSPLDIGGQETVKSLKTTAASSSSSSSSSEGSSGASGSSASASSSKGIDSVIRSFLTSQGKMAVDSATNSIIITDSQAALDHIQKMLLELDVPQQQVILEVHVMEIQKGLISDKGIDWAGSDGAIVSFRAGQRTSQFPFNETLARRISGSGVNAFAPGSSEDDLLSAVDPADAAAQVTNQMTMGVINANNFSAVLRFVMTDSETKILARPRVLTQNNEAAVIRLVTNTSIANQTETTTSTGTTTSSTNEAERTETGVTLRMTPQINPDDSVTLFLEPSVTTVGNSVFFSDDFLDPTTRVVRTMARIDDNQTLVIGGLIDSTQIMAKRKIPYLGDIPGLGRLFSYEAIDNQDRELVIFITPHVVKGQNSLTQSNVTANGKDIAATKLMNEFIDKEADLHLSAYEVESQRIDTISDANVRRERFAAAQASSKASDPKVEKQMSMALDAFSPQLLDDEITKALSFQSSQHHSKNG